MIINNQCGNSDQNTINHTTGKFAVKSDQISFADKLVQAAGAPLSKEEQEDLRPADSIGIIMRQMRMYGEESKVILHNGVPISINGGQITIGLEKKDTKWASIKTKNGTVTFDLHDPDSVSKCLDLFSPEEVNQILFLFMQEKMAQEAEDGIEKELNKAYDSMGSGNEAESAHASGTR